MRSNVILWWLLSVFFLIVAVLYTGWNIVEHTHIAEIQYRIEWVGTIALLFSAFMGALGAVYLQRNHKRQGGELPEDILTSDIDDGDPEIGEFSPWSWWPLLLAASASIFVIGLAVGSWLTPIGVGVFLIAIVGWVYEYYRGNFAR